MPRDVFPRVFRSILCPVDFSPNSRAALRYAAMLARLSDAHLTVLYVDDPLLADRMHDLEDLSNRLLRIVSGQLGTAASQGLRGDAILIARNLGPACLPRGFRQPSERRPCVARSGDRH